MSEVIPPTGDKDNSNRNTHTDKVVPEQSKCSQFNHFISVQNQIKIPIQWTQQICVIFVVHVSVNNGQCETKASRKPYIFWQV